MDDDSYFITKVSVLLDSFSPRGGAYNFRCPFCGDSKKDRRKARGYLYQKDNEWFYKCFNCNEGTTFSSFLYRVSQPIYKEYRANNFKSGVQRNKLFEALLKKKEVENQEIIEKSIDINLLRSIITPILQLPNDHVAMEYVKSRLIPENRFRELYYIDDINELKIAFDGYEDVNFFIEPRLVLPVINRDNNIVGLITRSLAKNPRLRYVNLKVSDETPLLFNLNGIDESKPIMVVEGAIDSLFLDNCVSASNLHLKGLSNYFDKDNLTLVYDNEPRHKEVLAAMSNAIDEGYNVVIWPSKIKQKDINDMIKNGINNVKDIINTNTFKGQDARLRFQEWRKLF